MSYREMCLNAKGEECVICGTGENIQVHHIDGDRSNNDLENLAPLCPSCHGKIHSENGELEEWSSKLLPDHRRSRQKAIEITPDLERDIQTILKYSDDNSDTEVLESSVKERVEKIASHRERMDTVNEAIDVLGSDNSEEAITKALKMSVELIRSTEAVLEREDLTLQQRREIADEFSPEQVDPDHVAEVSMRGIAQSMLDQQISENELEALTV